jgi:endogenous inhibitor of DNA gyrase (YacG/DUF329 family)
MVTCPGCGEASPYDPGNRWRPFCSERCKMIDLGAWASDGYAIAGQPLEADDDLIDPETGKPRGTPGPAGTN